MSSLRVLHVVGGYPTPEKPFHQIFIKTQVESLRAAGIHCDVLLLQGAGFRKYLTGWAQVRRQLRESKYDLIHAHYSYCGAVSLGHGLPVVTSFLGSDLYGFPRPDGSFPKLTSALHMALARFVSDRSKDSIVKAQRMREALARDAHVVANGVDLDMFKPVSVEERLVLRRELGLAEDTYYLVFAGNPELPRKMYGLANEAFLLANKKVSRPMELLALTGRPHSDVVKHMQACDMLILTSTLEGSPNVVKEAMAAGMAVVAVDVGDTRERLAGVDGCRVVKDYLPASISEAIIELVNSEESRLGRHAVIPLAMDSVASRIKEIYQTTVE